MWKTIKEYSYIAKSLVFFISLGMGLLMSAPAQAGRAADLDKVYTCKGVAKGIPTTTINIYLEKFSIPAEWSEGGPHYEIATRLGVQVYPNKNSIKHICYVGVDWGTREFRKYNAWTGNRWTYPLDFNFTVHNVPVDSVTKFFIWMQEEDDNSNHDKIDLAEGWDIETKIAVYPSKQMGFVLDKADKEQNDSKHIIIFGKAKRVAGLGEPYPGNPGGTAIGTLDFTITASKSYAPNPGIGSKVGGAKKIGGAKSAVSCKQYAQNAVNRNTQAIKLGCGFKSPEWSSNYQMHYDWCMRGDNYKSTSIQTARRAKNLKDCKIKQPAAGAEGACRSYALTAVNLNRQAIDKKCGFKPPVWSNNHQMHFDWCMRGNNNKRAAKENAKRFKAIQSCKVGSSKKSNVPSAAKYCQIYAQDAINQFHAGQQRGCGFLGPEWSPQFNWHYNWCVQTYKAGNISAIAAGAAKRNSMLATCN